MGGRPDNLWMGDVDPYMDDNFIRAAFYAMGETVLSVKIMRDRYTYDRLGYCFVEFPSEESAENALRKLNGKLIPSSDPPRKFKLNYSGQNRRSSSSSYTNKSDFSLWVGELSSDVDDNLLYRSFKSLYPSTESAVVMKDYTTGRSRGYGFVKFESESEQQMALIQMQGYRGCGYSALRVSLATKKRPYGQNSSQSNSDYSGYYGNYYPNSSGTSGDYSQYYQNSSSSTNEDLGDLAEEEHAIPLDILGDNRELIKRADDLYSELDSCRWTIDEDRFKIIDPTTAIA